MIKLTAKEVMVLREAWISSSGYDHNFGFIDELHDAASDKVLSDIVSSLVSKGILKAYDQVLMSYSGDKQTIQRFILSDELKTNTVSELWALFKIEG